MFSRTYHNFADSQKENFYSLSKQRSLCLPEQVKYGKYTTEVVHAPLFEDTWPEKTDEGDRYKKYTRHISDLLTIDQIFQEDLP